MTVAKKCQLYSNTKLEQCYADFNQLPFNGSLPCKPTYFRRGLWVLRLSRMPKPLMSSNDLWTKNSSITDNIDRLSDLLTQKLPLSQPSPRFSLKCEFIASVLYSFPVPRTRALTEKQERIFAWISTSINRNRVFEWKSHVNRHYQKKVLRT